MNMGKIVYKTNENIKSSQNTIKKRNVTVIWDNNLVKIGLLIMSFFFFYNIYRSFTTAYQKLEIERRAREEVSRLRVKNLSLGLELEDMKSNEFLEIQARDRLNLSGSNEYVFIIDQKLLDSARNNISAYLNEVGENESKTAYEAWYKFFLDGV